MTTEAEYAWAAGIFEGEGCIYQGRNSSGNTTPVLVVKMTDEDVIQRLTEVLSFGSFYAITKWPEGHKRPFQWRATGWPSFELFSQHVGPYLGERRRAKLEAVRASRRVTTYAPDCPNPSYGRYKAHKRKHEDPCMPCTQKMREASSRWREVRREKRTGVAD